MGGKKLAYDYIKNVQTDVCVMVGDIREGNTGHPVVLVNDTRNKQKVEINIEDKDSGRILLSKTVEVEANGKLNVDELPEVDKNELWIIDYKVDGKTYNNHYLAFKPVMKLEKYKKWLPILSTKF